MAGLQATSSVTQPFKVWGAPAVVYFDQHLGAIQQPANNIE